MARLRANLLTEAERDTLAHRDNEHLMGFLDDVCAIPGVLPFGTSSVLRVEKGDWRFSDLVAPTG